MPKEANKTLVLKLNQNLKNQNQSIVNSTLRILLSGGENQKKNFQMSGM